MRLLKRQMIAEKGAQGMNWSTRVVWISLVLCMGVGVDVGAGSGDIDEMIRKNRMGELVIEAKPGASVRVEQVRHEFWFGAAISSSVFGGRMDAEDVRRYKEVFLANFNAGVTENALKWHAMEPRKGQVDYSIVDAILEWTQANEIPLRGHNIFWGISGRVQDWVKQLDDDELRETLRKRAIDIASRYKGRFAEYDLNNEMIHGNYYADRLGAPITKQMAEWVKGEDPGAKLYLNDYDILTGKRLDDYVGQIRGFLNDGVPIDGVGVQGHLHGDSFDPAALREALDRLGEQGLPLCITEFNFPGQRSQVYQRRDVKLTAEQEQDKARALVEYYRICFAHPAVKGIMMWGFWERANWIPQSSLYLRDWTATPAAEAYRKLVFDEWWTRWEGKADADGRCRVPAFFGKHRVAVGGNERIVYLKKSAGVERVSLR
jgi:GH35 family endo-1,4-beta-xylanase